MRPNITSVAYDRLKLADRISEAAPKTRDLEGLKQAALDLAEVLRDLINGEII